MTDYDRGKQGSRNPDAVDPIRRLRVMGRLIRPRSNKPGAAPGTLVHTGPRKVEHVRLTYLDYDETGLREEQVKDPTTVWPLRDSPSVSWINVDGLHDIELIQRAGDHFGLHPLVLEDVVHVGQRPKLEEYDRYLYLVVSMLDWNEEGEGQVDDEQLSLILGPGWVLTFQERVGDVFEPVRERIRQSSRRIRSRGVDYLAYALVDAVVDRYFTVLERMGERTGELELEVLEDPTPDTMERLHRLKRELVVMRRAVAPVREMLNGLLRTEIELVSDETRVYLRDVHDHVVQVTEGVDGLRDVVGGTIDLYLSHVAHRQNEIMKVLTVMASIFIPLTFLAGIYGMNFEIMPELGLPWAYPALLGVMLVVGLGMVVYFKRKGWM